MVNLYKIMVGSLAIFCLLATQAALAETVTYYHTDPVGTPLAITDANGVKVWEADYLPFGEVYTETGAANDRKFVGKERDEESNLDYFGARYHYAKMGRFLAPDPVRAVSAQTGQINATILKNPQGQNLYSYSLNNSYRYVDPNGQFPLDTIWDAGNIVYDIATGDWTALAADTAALAIPYVPAGISKLGKVANKAEETAVVQRWMSKAELESTQNTGLLRGGREGTHYVTDAANTDPLRARQRLALPQTPEVRVTMEVPKNALSASSRVEPKFNMRGGGMERTASGDVSVRVLKVD